MSKKTPKGKRAVTDLTPKNPGAVTGGVGGKGDKVKYLEVKLVDIYITSTMPVSPP